jgi:hypothetical protein
VGKEVGKKTSKSELEMPHYRENRRDHECSRTCTINPYSHTVSLSRDHLVNKPKNRELNPSGHLSVLTVSGQLHVV